MGDPGHARDRTDQIEDRFYNGVDDRDPSHGDSQDHAYYGAGYKTHEYPVKAEYRVLHQCILADGYG